VGECLTSFPLPLRPVAHGAGRTEAGDPVSTAPPFTHDLVVIGGGAAGFFGAIAAAETAPGLRILILEKTSGVLGKVRISGGGRCNVTNALREPRELAERYPRGGRSLLGPFHRWGSAETVAWFEARGIKLKTEPDGRMFPVTDDSQTIIDCLTDAARRGGVEVQTRREMSGATLIPGGWEIAMREGGPIRTRALLLATGGVRGGIGAEIASQLGHHVEPAAPSLFTFNVSGHPGLEGLSGLSVPSAVVSVPGTKLRETGPVLITHWGLSGPAILRLSAWGARELMGRDYRFEVVIDWTGLGNPSAIAEDLARARSDHHRATVAARAQFGIPARLWQRLLEMAGLPADRRWSHVTREEQIALTRALGGSVYPVSGKSLNKDEFVTCGGVALKEVDFRTLRSRLVPGLYFAGEVLDIDGITGGFNFQAAWTTARIAGESIAEFCLSEKSVLD
jgi:predicted Rossmann fold flavoprotein